MCDHEDPPEGVCDACGAICVGVWQDTGIGSYEFWGTMGVDERWAWVSPCCCAEIVKPPMGEEDDAEV